MNSSELPPPPRNLKITIEYDGSEFVGWEKQKNGLGIQEAIESAIERITGEKTTVNGSGRTDAGVHAYGQVANFTLQSRLPAPELGRALNAVLPETIGIISCEEVSLFFHARFSARTKVYRYSVLNSRSKAPLTRHLTHQVRAELDLEAMRSAARDLVGRHDFTSFCREPELVDSCVRTVFRIDILREGRLVTFDLEGDGFLYNMVRIICGTLVYVGLGKIPADSMPEILGRLDRNFAGPTLPSRGLSLVGVFYGDP